MQRGTTPTGKLDKAGTNIQLIYIFTNIPLFTLFTLFTKTYSS